MTEARPLLGPSLSFSGTSSAPSRLPKRRMSSALDFFAPAASSFQPRPYAPNVQISEARTRALHSSRSQRDVLVMPPAGMDPQPADPNVFFIHPPFTTFPNSHLQPDGISYALMAENPEWFLDANDFASQQNTNPQAIPYPANLEPPRGWCPAKKKDLKERGSEGWPEGEEPRLRCTFCRRTYAGVNAKSMWRRHVFEKHKIAMSNRRDGNEHPRGRGSGKENKQLASSRSRAEPHDRLVNMEITPQTEPQTLSHKSRFRSVLPAEEPKRRDRDRKKSKEKFTIPATPRIPRQEFLTGNEDEDTGSSPYQPIGPPISPPLTPPPSLSSDSPNGPLQISDEPTTIQSGTMQPIIPPSPYNPLLTPSFRHSPPRLPSDQPWRFPSPSHPLHSQTRDVSLSMLIRDATSPLVKGSLVVGASPLVIQSSPISSPLRSEMSRSSNLETPSSVQRVPKSAARTLFSRSHFSSPLDIRKVGGRHFSRIEGSPLARNPRMGTGHQKSISSLSDDWFSESSLLSTGALCLDNSGNDPFVAIYNPWTNIGGGSTASPVRAPKPSIEGESPVLRSHTQSTGIGLGIGLLEPFTLPKDANSIDDLLADEADSDFRKELDEAEVLPPSCKSNVSEEVYKPPLKKRRTSLNHCG